MINQIMSSKLLAILVILINLLSLLLFLFINSLNGVGNPAFSSSLFKPILNLILFKSNKINLSINTTLEFRARFGHTRI